MNGWSFPTGFKKFLLKQLPSGSPGFRSEGIKSLHSTRRSGGLFIDRWAGAPDLSQEFEAALELAAQDLVEEQRRLRYPSQETILAAVEKLKLQHVDLYDVLAYFQTPPRLRRLSAEVFAEGKNISRNSLYRALEYAILAVWLYLPAGEREKFLRAEREQR